MILNVHGYDVVIRYIPGSLQVLADTLGRAVHNNDSKADKEFKATNVVLSVSGKRYEEFQKETKMDPELQAVLVMVKNGYPDTSTHKYTSTSTSSCRSKTVLDISR